MRRILPALALATALVASPAAAQEAPPPTPVPPFGSPSPYPSSLETPEPSARTPELTAPAAVLLDLDSGAILFERRARERRPVASTTKIMTALLVLERTAPDEIVTVSPGAITQLGAGLGLLPGEGIPVRQLLYALMLQSANDAAVALAEHVSGDVERFVADMNRRARRMGLEDTRFHSPNGLDDDGYSTAHDMAVITLRAFEEPLFARVVGSRFRRIPAPEGPPRRIQNRNALLWLSPGTTGVKTGYTAAAGFCLVASAERDGLRLASVVLGAPREAFTDSATLLDHGFTAYDRREVVETGQELDPIRVDGVEVPVAAGESLSVLVHADAHPVFLVRPDPGLTLPIGPGERMGVVEVRARGSVLGEVPLVATAAAVAPAETGEDVELRPWWSLALEWAADLWAGLVGGFG
jgi:serine-type D-Ala-D-Ala carboxypeptidase (penicillin-binding protein 5/6)